MPCKSDREQRPHLETTASLYRPHWIRQEPLRLDTVDGDEVGFAATSVSPFHHIRRITGYLVSPDRFNNSKRAEGMSAARTGRTRPDAPVCRQDGPRDSSLGSTFPAR